jgi:hypothetical protein
MDLVQELEAQIAGVRTATLRQSVGVVRGSGTASPGSRGSPT